MDGVVLMAMCQMKSWVTRKNAFLFTRAFMASSNNPETSRYHLEIFQFMKNTIMIFVRC